MTLHHMALEVREDEAEADVGFWALLGFQEVEPPGSLRGSARWLERDGQQIHLMFRDEPVVPGGGHAAVVAEDYRGVLAELRRTGHEVDVRPAHWGSPRAFVRTPCGHRVELMLFPPR